MSFSPPVYWCHYWLITNSSVLAFDTKKEEAILIDHPAFVDLHAPSLSIYHDHSKFTIEANTMINKLKTVNQYTIYSLCIKR